MKASSLRVNYSVNSLEKEELHGPFLCPNSTLITSQLLCLLHHIGLFVSQAKQCLCSPESGCPEGRIPVCPTLYRTVSCTGCSRNAYTQVKEGDVRTETESTDKDQKSSPFNISNDSNMSCWSQAFSPMNHQTHTLHSTL